MSSSRAIAIMSWSGHFNDEQGHRKRFILACLSGNDSHQPAHQRSLIRALIFHLKRHLATYRSIKSLEGHWWELASLTLKICILYTFSPLVYSLLPRDNLLTTFDFTTAGNRDYVVDLSTTCTFCWTLAQIINISFMLVKTVDQLWISWFHWFHNDFKRSY